MKTYHVVVTREDGNWLADVPGLPGAHTDARSLRTLDRYVREVIALIEDMTEGAEDHLDLDYEFHTGDETLDALVAEAREARHHADAEQKRAAELTRRAVSRVKESGAGRRSNLSYRDTAVLLDISHQRVQQLTDA